MVLNPSNHCKGFGKTRGKLQSSVEQDFLFKYSKALSSNLSQNLRTSQCSLIRAAECIIRSLRVSWRVAPVCLDPPSKVSGYTRMLQKPTASVWRVRLSNIQNLRDCSVDLRFGSVSPRWINTSEQTESK